MYRKAKRPEHKADNLSAKYFDIENEFHYSSTSPCAFMERQDKTSCNLCPLIRLDNCPFFQTRCFTLCPIIRKSVLCYGNDTYDKY